MDLGGIQGGCIWFKLSEIKGYSLNQNYAHPKESHSRQKSKIFVMPLSLSCNNFYLNVDFSKSNTHLYHVSARII